MGYLKGTMAAALAIASMSPIGRAMAGDEAVKVTVATEEQRLCYLDGKKNSLGAMVSIEQRTYRCTPVLEERGKPAAAWVAVKMTAAIVTD
jgi:hypothetical protein